MEKSNLSAINLLIYEKTLIPVRMQTL